jgi:transcription antitermination factor NusG
MTPRGELSVWEKRMQAPPDEAIPSGLPGVWWVAHTKPRNEKALALTLWSLRIPVYLPLHRRETRSRATGRVSRSIMPVFAGYLFFNASEEQRCLALTTNRIAQTLAVIDQEDLVGHLRQIQRVLAAGAHFRIKKALEVGEWARVIAGPLEGVEGVIAQRRSRLRLVLNVQTLGQSVSVEVTEDVLERIDSPSFATAQP